MLESGVERPLLPQCLPILKARKPAIESWRQMLADTLGTERLQVHSNAQESTAAIHSISDFDFFGLSGFFGSVLGARCVRPTSKKYCGYSKALSNHDYLEQRRAVECQRRVATCASD